MRITLIVRPAKSGYIELPEYLSEEEIELVWEQLKGLMIYYKAAAQARATKTQTADGATGEAP